MYCVHYDSNTPTQCHPGPGKIILSYECKMHKIHSVVLNLSYTHAQCDMHIYQYYWLDGSINKGVNSQLLHELETFWKGAKEIPGPTHHGVAYILDGMAVLHMMEDIPKTFGLA